MEKHPFPSTNRPLGPGSARYPARGTLIGVFAVLAAMTLTGCGFHPRGQVDPINGINSLQVKGPTALVHELVLLLDGNGITVTSDQPDAILAIGNESFDKRTLLVDSDTGKEREHTLAYEVTYRLLSTDGTKELIPQQTVTLLQDYIFDEDAVLGTGREQQILYQEMRRDAVGRILRSLVAWRRP